MDFSRPENARKINKLKVLNALRERPQSKAELSLTLGINKVSIGEICTSLHEEGLIEIAGKEEGCQGRPGVLYAINGKAGRVFSLTISAKAASAAASDTAGRILRYERFPRTESFQEDLEALMRKMAGSARIYGAAVIAPDDEPAPELPFPIARISRAEAEAASERARSGERGRALFISWDEDIKAALIDQDGIRLLPEFPHIRAQKDGICGCGGRGCLEAASSAKALMRASGHASIKELLQDRALIREALRPMAAALTQGVQALSADAVIISGAMSAIDEEEYGHLRSMVSSLLPPRRSQLPIRRSAGSAAEGAAILALDAFFYQKRLLERLESIESL